MKVCVTGATGFVGAHVVRALAERGDDVRVIYRKPNRLQALTGIRFRRAKCDVLDFRALKRALRDAELLFHVAGYVASSPMERVWQLNARGPEIAVEAAAAAGVPRVVVTSTISAIGVANGTPADEETSYPQDWLGLAYPDSKHVGETAAPTLWWSTRPTCWASRSTAQRRARHRPGRSAITCVAACPACSTRR